MIAVGVMQPAVDEPVLVVAVRHHFVPAIVVAAFARRGLAFARVLPAHRDGVLVVVALVLGVQVAVVEVVDVAIVLNAGVATVVRVLVRVVLVFAMGHGM